MCIFVYGAVDVCVCVGGGGSRREEGSVTGVPLTPVGLFPGDAILEVNGEGVKYAPVEKVVAAITRVSPRSREK